MASATLAVCGTGSALLAYSIGLSGSLPVSLIANSTAALTNPTWVAFSPDGAFTYVVDEQSNGSVSPFQFSGNSFVQVGPSEQSDSPGTVHAALHPSMNWMASASYAGSSAAIYPRASSTGVLGSPIAVWSPGEFAHAVTWGDPQTLFIPCLGSNYIAQYHFDVVTGGVTPSKVHQSQNPSYACYL